MSEIDNSTLIKMGFHKVENSWVFHKSRTHREEHGGSNLNNEEGDDAVPMEDDMVQATEQLMEEAQAQAHMQAHQRVDLGQP